MAGGEGVCDGGVDGAEMLVIDGSAGLPSPVLPEEDVGALRALLDELVMLPQSLGDFRIVHLREESEADSQRGVGEYRVELGIERGEESGHDVGSRQPHVRDRLADGAGLDDGLAMGEVLDQVVEIILGRRPVGIERGSCHAGRFGHPGHGVSPEENRRRFVDPEVDARLEDTGLHFGFDCRLTWVGHGSALLAGSMTRHRCRVGWSKLYVAERLLRVDTYYTRDQEKWWPGRRAIGLPDAGQTGSGGR